MSNPLRPILSTILVVFTLVAGACAVDPSDAEMTMMVDVAASADPTSSTDPASAAPSPTPEDLGIEVNDAGEQLLPRVITGSFEAGDCDFVEELSVSVDPECGWLIRPLHGSTNKDIELPVMVFRATGPDPAPDPLIYLHGGPTGGILEFFAYPELYADIVEPFVADRDVIVFDQRGTGLAEPDLKCDSPAIWYNARDENPETFVPRTANTCATSLRVNGIRLDQFSRQSSADDVMVLARELGYESFNLHGSSWGGILAYTVMQLHPEWVRSSILDSPLSVDTDLTGSMPGSFQEAMSGMQANCDLDPSCSARHGDVVARYVRVFEALEERPVFVPFLDYDPLEVTADELSYLLFAIFYSPEHIAQVPDLLLDLENGDTELLTDMIFEFGWGWGFDFAFLTYMCTDIVPASSQAQVEAQQIGIEAFDRVDDAPDGRGHTAASMCERMQVRRPAAPAVRETVPTTPTIVLAGRMDPITPYSSGQSIVEALPNGYFVGFDDRSHGVTNDPCGIDIAQQFIGDPSTAPDLSCSLPENRPLFEFVRVAVTVPG